MKVESQLGKLPTWMSRNTGPVGPADTSKPAPKTIGELPPTPVKLADFPQLAPLFAHYGAIQKIRRKLKRLTGRDAKIILAKNTVGAADNKGNLYLGVDFLQEYGGNDALIAGVMAHEWGHLMSNLSKRGSLEHLSWEQIYELRREEEASADAFCGRNLALMGFTPDQICGFLREADKGDPTVKYYAAPIRVAIIEEGFQRSVGRGDATRKLFPDRTYANPYTSKLILADE